jgi:hypothetical protein
MTAAVAKLDLQQEPKLGIDLRTLKSDAERYLAQLLAWEQTPFAPYDLDIILTDERLQTAVAALIDNPPEPHDD